MHTYRRRSTAAGPMAEGRQLHISMIGYPQMEYCGFTGGSPGISPAYQYDTISPEPFLIDDKLDIKVDPTQKTITAEGKKAGINDGTGNFAESKSIKIKLVDDQLQILPTDNKVASWRK
jgi:hypothetical protein